MTVKELKELLADVPDDVEVEFCADICDIYNNASVVRTVLRLTKYIGYTVTLKTDLNADDFDFFEDFLEAHGEYNLFDCKGKVLLVVDGMNGEYARFVFVDERIRGYWAEEKEYYSYKHYLLRNAESGEANVDRKERRCYRWSHCRRIRVVYWQHGRE